MSGTVLAFCGVRAQVEDVPGQEEIVVRGEGAAEFVAEIKRLIEFEQHARKRELVLMDRMEFRDYLELPSLK